MKKKISIILMAIIAVLCLSFGLVGCGVKDDPTQQPTVTYTITFNSNGGSHCQSITGELGKEIVLPTPTKEGYAFDGWFTDNNTFEASFTATTITGNITLYAKWTEIGNTTEHTHNYSLEWTSDDVNHWHVCTSTEGTCDTPQKDINPHEWNDGEITTQATPEHDGIKTYTCTVCGKTKEEPFAYTAPDHEHQLTPYSANAANCTEDGNIAYWYCSVCDKYYSDGKGRTEITQTQTIISASHTEQVTKGTPATCTESGTTDKVICSVCGEIIQEQTTIPAKGHNYQDGVCLNCGDTITYSQGLTYKANSDQSGYIVTGLGECMDKDIYIPAKYNGYHVLGIDNNAFLNMTAIKSFYIPDSVTYIGNYAFSGCSGLTNINIPNYVTSIGNYAFSGCSSLRSITIPDSVASISTAAFRGCSSLESITLPFVGGSKKTSSDTYQYPFGYIFGTTSYTGGIATSQHYYGSSTSYTTGDTYYIPASLKSVIITGDNILSGAFYNCSMLTSITIPNSVTSIGSSAFLGCSGLTSIIIPDSVTSIGDYAFSGCSGLTNINFPNYVTSIGDNAFLNCSELITVNWNATNCTKAGSYSYPIFKNCANLTTVNIGDNVTTIPAYAFYDCSFLKNIHITDIASWCKISGLNNLIQYGSINKNLYLNNELVTDLVIPNSVMNIEDYALYGCSEVASITIPSSVTSIGGYAFSGCSGLTNINIPDSVTSIGDYTFSGCSGLTNINIPNYVTSIGKYAFSGCSSLTSITIPDSATSISTAAFRGCLSLESITLPFVGGSKKTSSDIYQYPFGYIFGTTSYAGGIATTQYYYGSSTSSTISNTYYIPLSLKSVTITGGNILYGAFYGCNLLDSITISGSVTSIESSAFLGCSSLTSITIPDSVASISNAAFRGCSSLESITLPFVGGSKKTSSDTYQYPFGYIFGTTSYTGGIATSQYYYDSSTSYTTGDTYYIPSSLKSVIITGGNVLSGAFYNCSMLTSITIPNSVTSIGSSAFLGCSGLTSIIIPDSVTSIGDYAFSGCSGLTIITIPENVTSIGYNIFSNCSSLTSITVPTNNQNYQSIEGNLYTKGGKALIQYAVGKTDNSFVIPDGVTSIGDYAFSDCSSLTSITISDSVTNIGSSAFSGCSGLTVISVANGNTKYHSDGNCLIVTQSKTLILGCSNSVIPTDGSVTSIRYDAFRDCSSLTSIAIPDSVTSIGERAFCGCTNLTSIIFGENSQLSSIRYDAFRDCSSLTSIAIPDSVTSIGERAFCGCSSLESITLPFVGGSKKTSSDTYQYPFGYIFGTTSYAGGIATSQHYYGSSTSYTTGDTYYIPASLKSVIITGDNILSGAFYNCSMLTSITIPNSVTSIGSSAFLGCSGLTSITIPNSVTSIGSSAFLGCSGLTSITIPENVTSIGNSAFYGCTRLTSIAIPENVTSIGYNIFSNCSSLTSITVPTNNQNYQSIEGNLYTKDGKALIQYAVGKTDNSFVIPDGVTSIGSGAFSGCSSLTSITIPESVTSIGNYAFSDCKSLGSITIPRNVTSIGCNAFSGCSRFLSVKFIITNGWKVSPHSNMSSPVTTISSSDLADTSTASRRLWDTYCDYYWKRGSVWS